MKFCSLLRDGIKLNDLFYVTEMLRYDKEMEYRSITGGIFSLGIIIAVLVGFANMIIDTISLNTINSVNLITKDTTLSSSSLLLGTASKFMMAVQLRGVNQSDPIRYFDVLMTQTTTSNGSQDYIEQIISLELCTPQHWAAFPDIVEDFNRMSMDTWLCPPINTVFSFGGDYTSDIFQYVNVSVNPCDPLLDPNRRCASQQELAEKFQSNCDAIQFKIYYTNPLINSGQKNYKSYYLETRNYINFGATIGGQSFIYAADYQITTDTSIWPYSSVLNDDGVIIEDRFELHPFTTFIGSYASYLIVKSPTKYTYQREVQKISNIFSFIGGLISAISTALFIFKSYNSLTFELTVALNIFKPPKSLQKDVKQLSINFCTFFKYHYYQFCRSIGRPRQWPVIQYLVQCRRQIMKQLDVKALIKRIIFLEYCMTHLFEDYQLEGLQLQKPCQPMQIAKTRKKIESIDHFQEEYIQEDSFKQSSSENENESDSNFGEKKSPADITIIDIVSLGQFQKFKKEQAKINKQASLGLNNNSSLISNQTGIRLIKKNHVYPIDPDSVNDEIKINEGINNFKQTPVECRIKNKRQSKIQQRRSTQLQILKKNAEQGNPLSKKIWNQLEQFNHAHSRFKKNNLSD